MFSLGIDVTNKSCRYLLLNEDRSKGKILLSGQSPWSLPKPPGTPQRTLHPHGKSPLRAEASRGFRENLYSHLKENGFFVVLLNPYHTNKFREALAQQLRPTISMLWSSPNS